MASGILFLAFAAAASAMPAIAPTPVNLECLAVDVLVNVMHASSSATPFCSSFLSIPTRTLVSTATSTPPVLTVTVTNTQTGYTTDTLTAVATSTALATNVITEIDTLTETDSFTETDISTEIDTITTTNTVIEIDTLTAAATITQTFPTTITVTAGAQRRQNIQVLDRRASLKPTTTHQAAVVLPTPSYLAGLASSIISNACSCLSVPTSTVTSTTTSTLVSVTTTTTLSLAITLPVSVTTTDTETVTTTTATTTTTDVSTTLDVTSTTETTTTTDVATGVDATSTIQTFVTSSTTTTITTTAIATYTPPPQCSSPGTNIVQNPGFESGLLSPWTATNRYATPPAFMGISSPGDGSNYDFKTQAASVGGSVMLSQVLPTVSGVTYQVSFNYLTSSNQASSIYCYAPSYAAGVITSGVAANSWGATSGSFTATSSSTTFTCYFALGGNQVLQFDNLYVGC